MVSGIVESCGDSDGFYGFFFTMKVQVTFFSKDVPKIISISISSYLQVWKAKFSIFVLKSCS